MTSRRPRRAARIAATGHNYFFPYLGACRRASAKDPCESDRCLTTRLTRDVSDATVRFDLAPSAFAVGTLRQVVKIGESSQALDERLGSLRGALATAQSWQRMSMLTDNLEARIVMTYIVMASLITSRHV